MLSRTRSGGARLLRRGLMPFYCLSFGLIGVAFVIWAIQRVLGKNDNEFWG